MALLIRFFFLCISVAAAAEKWKINYFYDQPESNFELRGIQFPSDQRGLVYGVITGAKEKERPLMLITSNGGEKWIEVPLKESPVSLSCIDDSQCWLATDKGIWKTEESGRDWKKLKKQEGIAAIHFTNSRIGFAAGYPKSVWKTTDGGLTWTSLPAAAKVEASSQTTAFDVIAQNGNDMMIIGLSRLRRMDGSLYPDWMEPERAASRREWPALTVMLDSRDGGANWNASSASLFGHIVDVKMGEGMGISLIVHEQAFQYPSEVLKIDFKSGKNTPIHFEKDRLITSIHLGKNNNMVIGGIEVLGSFRANPTPSKVRIQQGQLTDSNTVIWMSMPVDYKAVARRVTLASTPSGKLWAVTDTGMILEWK